jgi:transcriptional regulator with XRE-family HTH domain
MPTRSSPTLRRWELASRLRRLRETRGLSLEDVAGDLECSTSKVSRIETAARGASLRDVRDLCRLYDVDEGERESLLELVRQAKQAGWWQRYDEVASRSATYLGLEDAATSIQNYEPSSVPGLLQTSDYTRALVSRVNVSLTREAIDQYVQSRRERHQRLLGDNPPQCWVIIDEAVLHRLVGGAKVMHDQLQEMIKHATDRRVIIQVVPFSAGAHAGMEGSFTLLQFADSDLPDVVYLESRAGELLLHRDMDLRLYRETFDHLRASAESPDASVERMEALAQRLLV